MIDAGTLGRVLDGRIVRRGDPDMVLARKQFAARLPFVEPDLLIRCTSAEDVARCVSALGRTDVPFALRSGGHCFADRSNAAPVIVDMTEIDAIRIDGTLATIGAGVRAADGVDALGPSGRAIPTGGCIGVAVGGLAMVGGFGYLGRAHGFLADRVRSFRVVLADGSLAEVDERSEPDLFWALRGGGGIGLAAVTDLTIETVAAQPGIALHGEWPIDHAPELIDRWQRWAPLADGAVNVELTLRVPDLPDDPPVVQLHGGVLGSDLKEVRTGLGAFFDDVEAVPLGAAELGAHYVGRLDHHGAPAWQPSQPYRAVGFQATRSHFFARPVGRAALTDLVMRVAADRRYAQAREVEFIPWGGAYRHAPSPACIAHRDAAFLVRHTVMTGSRSTPEDRAAATAAAEASYAALSREGGGAYAGYAELDRARWQQDAFGPLLDRLLQVRRQYDPNGVFARAR